MGCAHDMLEKVFIFRQFAFNSSKCDSGHTYMLRIPTYIHAAPVWVFQKSFLSTRENVISHAFKWNETQLKWLLDNASESVWVVLFIHFKPKFTIMRCTDTHIPTLLHSYTFRTFQQLIQWKSILFWIFCTQWF